MHFIRTTIYKAISCNALNLPGNKYDCKSSYEILSQDGKVCVAKATMAFDNFSRVDYITLNQGKDGWKVSKVETTYS